MSRILFPSHHASAEIAPGETLLDAARRADVGLESPCDGAGTCGKCAMRMGAACRPKVTEHAHDLLSETERADGWVLACQTTMNVHSLNESIVRNGSGANDEDGERGGDITIEVELAAAPGHGEGLRILSEGHALEVAPEPWISKRFDEATGATQVFAGRGANQRGADNPVCSLEKNELRLGDVADRIVCPPLPAAEPGIFSVDGESGEPALHNDHSDTPPPLGSEPGDTTAHLYGLAVDIGTTTMVSVLVDLRDGRELAQASGLNPQARYGQDVLSRIKLGSTPEGLAQLQTDVIAELNRHAADVAAQAGIAPAHIYEAVFSGNTTMLYLALGVDPAPLGRAPYTLTRRGAEHVRASEIGLAIAPFGLVWLPPVISAYVGADITAGLLAARLPEARGTTLFIDIGTNGEMVLARDGKLTATSTAAGPAFEGMNITCGMRAGRGAVERVELFDEDGQKPATDLETRERPAHSSTQTGLSAPLSCDGLAFATIGNAEPVGLCGSGLLDAVAELAHHGALDKGGRFRCKPSDWAADVASTSASKPWQRRWETVDGKPVFRIAGPVFLSQKDVRQVQLAKAAIRAGIELMLRANSVAPADVGRVLIAGSFGFHLRAESLIHLGLLPPQFAGRVEFLGNTARTGAQALLLKHPLRRYLAQVTAQVQALELAQDPAFEKTFVRAMAFGERVEEQATEELAQGRGAV